MIISHEFALEKASQASIDGNYMEGICFSLLALALSDGLRNNPSLNGGKNSDVDYEVASLATLFFSDPSQAGVFERLQEALARRNSSYDHTGH
jgi:hypothetical protein